MGRKRKLQDVDEDEATEVDLPPKHLTVSHLRKEEKRLIVILEKAQLETAKVREDLIKQLISFLKEIVYLSS